MAVTYATYSDFTAIYSVRDLTQAEIENSYLPHGALRVNEELGGMYTTPFSSNNHTARDLSIRYGYLQFLINTRNQNDSTELNGQLEKRIAAIKGGSLMINDSGQTIDPDHALTKGAWSSTQEYKNTFDMRDSINQRVDPDLITDLWYEDV